MIKSLTLVLLVAGLDFTEICKERCSTYTVCLNTWTWNSLNILEAWLVFFLFFFWRKHLLSICQKEEDLEMDHSSESLGGMGATHLHLF